MSEWQPIETAPTERWVLTWSEDGYEVALKLALDNKWICTANIDDNMMWEVKPTHWQPLPEPPK